MPRSPEDMAAAMVANMKEKTGKTLPQWTKIAKGAKVEKHGQLVKWLKEEHGLTHGYANLIAHKTLKSDAGSQEGDLVSAHESGDQRSVDGGGRPLVFTAGPAEAERSRLSRHPRL